MATDETSQPAATDSRSASEAPNPCEGLSLDDLPPAQMQQLLEATLRRFQEAEGGGGTSRVGIGTASDSGIPAQQQPGASTKGVR